MSSLLQIIPMNEENDMLDDTLRYFLTDEKYKKYRTETLNDGIMCSVETTRPFQSLFRVTYKTNNVVRDITFVGNTKEGIIKTLIAMDIPNTSKFNIEEIINKFYRITLIILLKICNFNQTFNFSLGHCICARFDINFSTSKNF